MLTGDLLALKNVRVKLGEVHGQTPDVDKSGNERRRVRSVDESNWFLLPVGACE